jgi:CP family cyanate transporter-like MFS transporter
VILGVIIFVLALPALLLKENPRQAGQWVDGVEGRVIPEPGAADDLGTPQREVGSIVRTPLFWMLFSIFGIEAWALGVYAADQVIYLKTMGVAAIASSGALGISGGVAAVSGILFCRLSDRISPYFVLIVATSTMTIGSIVFLFARSAPPLFAYSILFGAGYGLLVPTIPTAFSRYFGARDFSRAFGVGTILTSIMGGLGPFVTGVISEATGSFTVPIYLITGLLVLSVVIAALSRPPRYALAGIERVEDGEHAEPRPAATAGVTDEAP